eukprot:scaffold229403_cov29-Tisochrysis_lutea.AAC.4
MRAPWRAGLRSKFNREETERQKFTCILRSIKESSMPIQTGRDESLAFASAASAVRVLSATARTNSSHCFETNISL